MSAVRRGGKGVSREVHSDSDDEDSFAHIAERKVQITHMNGKKEVVRTSMPPSMADVRDLDTTVSECPVCANSMKETLTTPCGHVFCKKVRTLIHRSRVQWGVKVAHRLGSVFYCG